MQELNNKEKQLVLTNFIYLFEGHSHKKRKKKV